MKLSFRSLALCAAVGAALSFASLNGTALAQPPGGPGGFGGGPGQGGPPPGGPGGPGRPGGPMGMMGPVTALQLPMPVLEKALQLTEDQKSQIDQIKQDTNKARRDLQPPQPDPGSPPPDPEEMRAAFDKIRALDQEANKKIEAVLSDDQKKTLSNLLMQLNDFRIVGLPGEIAPELKLTSDQVQKIHDIAMKTQKAMQQIFQGGPPQGGDPGAMRDKMNSLHKKAHDSALAVLTDTQRQTVEQFEKTHPRPGPGRFGGPGGPGGPGRPGGPGGPPPGGPDGPPPGGPDGPPPAL